MKSKSVLALTLAAAALTNIAGCANPNVMKLASLESSRSMGDDEALLVVGNLSDAKLAWDRVSVEGGVSKPLDGLKLYDSSTARFSVWKVGNLKNLRTLGLAYAIVDTRHFRPCGNGLMPVVSLAPGEVVYVGDFDHQITAGKMSMQWSFNTAAATESVKTQWSSDVASRLVEKRFAFVKTTAECGTGGTVTIPIYLPGR